MLKNEQLQMSLFDEDLQEVEIDQVRYILRCNSHRKQELADNRADKIKFISTKIEEKNTYLPRFFGLGFQIKRKINL